MGEDSHKRTDDAFFRKIIGTLVAALILELIGWIFSVGVLVAQIEENAEDINDNKQAIVQLREVNNRLIRIEVLMETLLVSNNTISSKLSVVASEQDMRGPIVRESAVHMNDKGMHK